MRTGPGPPATPCIHDLSLRVWPATSSVAAGGLVAVSACWPSVPSLIRPSAARSADGRLAGPPSPAAARPPKSWRGSRSARPTGSASRNGPLAGQNAPKARSDGHRRPASTVSAPGSTSNCATGAGSSASPSTWTTTGVPSARRIVSSRRPSSAVGVAVAGDVEPLEPEPRAHRRQVERAGPAHDRRRDGPGVQLHVAADLDRPRSGERVLRRVLDERGDALDRLVPGRLDDQPRRAHEVVAQEDASWPPARRPVRASAPCARDSRRRGRRRRRRGRPRRRT